jgi:uncharacterized membrane protein YphA (DoxX/SURF4 family)
MKIATLIIRILVGGLMLFASINYFFQLSPEPKFTGDMLTFVTGIAASKYLMPLAKVIELVAGLTIITGKFMKIGALILLPITINILFINIILVPEGTPIAAALLLGNLFLIYTNWETYKGIFKA